jgi:hypothetical protein
MKESGSFLKKRTKKLFPFSAELKGSALGLDRGVAFFISILGAQEFAGLGGAE